MEIDSLKMEIDTLKMEVDSHRMEVDWLRMEIIATCRILGKFQYRRGHW